MPGVEIYEHARSGVLDAILHCPPPAAWQSAMEILCRTFESSHGYLAWLAAGNSQSACISCYCEVHGFGELRSLGPVDWPSSWEQLVQSTATRLSRCQVHDCHCEHLEHSLAMPLIHRQTVVGMLSISREHLYDESEASTLAGMSHLLGTALVAVRNSWGRPPHVDEGSSSQLAETCDPCEEFVNVSNAIPGEVLGQLVEHSVTELQLRRQLADVHAILDSTDAVIYVKDLNGRYEFINRKYEEIFHVKRPSVVGLTDLEIFSQAPDLAARFQENDRLIARLGRPHQFEEQAPQNDGTHTYVSVKFPLRDSEGVVRATAGISTDITARKKSELQLATEQRRTEQILASVADGVVRLDQDGLIQFLNGSAREMLAVPQQYQVEGCSFHDSFHHSTELGEGYAWTSCPVHKVLSSGLDAIDQQTQFFRMDGQRFAVEFSAVAIFEGGTQDGVVLTFRDITARLERRRLRQQLEAAQAVQKNLYPKSNPVVPGFDIAGAVFPANPVCGDYYDFIWRDAQHLAMVVADACGHDLSAALMMVDARANLRSRLSTSDPMEKIMTDVNRILKADLQAGKFVTGFLAEVDVDNRRICYAGAGARAILIRSDGGIMELVGDGLMLGIDDSVGMQGVACVDVKPGDVLLMASDGLGETMSPGRELFGNRRVHELLRDTRSLPAREIVSALYSQARDFAGARWPQDDIAMIVVKAVEHAGNDQPRYRVD